MWVINFLFCLRINTKIFWKFLIVSIWVFKARHAQSTQNNKFAISFQYLTKKVSGEGFFCMQRSMKVSYKSILWVWFGLSSLPKVPKIASLQPLSFISNKKLKMKLVICMQISMKMVTVLWPSTCPARWYNQYWWAWSNIVKVLNVNVLQYFYNISKYIWKHFCNLLRKSVATAIVLYCDAKYSDILRGPVTFFVIC